MSTPVEPVEPIDYNPVALSASQVKLLRMLLRIEYRKKLKARDSMIGRYGAAARLDSVDARIASIRTTYVALGGDPERIRV